VRPDGFATADHDVGFLQDERVLDAVDVAGVQAVVAYLAVRDASWSRGERVAFGPAVRRLSIAYGLGDLDALQAVLVHVGLLDDDGRIPAKTWDSWYGVAESRRRERREAGRRGGLAKARNRARSPASPSSPVAPLQLSSSDALPVRQDGLTPVRPDGRTSELRVAQPMSSTATVYCLLYDDHRSQHRRAYAGGPFVCDVCGPRPGPSFGERMAAAGSRLARG